MCSYELKKKKHLDNYFESSDMQFLAQNLIFSAFYAVARKCRACEQNRPICRREYSTSWLKINSLPKDPTNCARYVKLAIIT